MLLASVFNFFLYFQSVVFLNQHLVDNGFAHWISSEEDAQQQQQCVSSSSEVAEPATDGGIAVQ